jgi:hypothetical protein
MTENPGGSLHKLRSSDLSIDKDSDIESLTTMVSKDSSLGCGQLPAIPRNPGPQDDHEGDTESSISQKVRLASDTIGIVVWSILIQYLTSFLGYYSINTTKATSVTVYAVVFNYFGDIQANDNFGLTRANDNSILSAERPICKSANFCWC